VCHGSIRLCGEAEAAELPGDTFSLRAGARHASTEESVSAVSQIMNYLSQQWSGGTKSYNKVLLMATRWSNGAGTASAVFRLVEKDHILSV
jgi:hypothetical protein